MKDSVDHLKCHIYKEQTVSLLAEDSFGFGSLAPPIRSFT